MTEVMVCICGYRMEGDESALRAAYRAHADEAHPQWPISDERIEDMRATRRRMEPWDGTREPLQEPVDVRPLTPALLGDYLRFFDHEGFRDNPAWASCYCHVYSYTGDDWQERNGEQNRADRAAAITAGKAQGYLAYAAGKPVGWCNAAPRVLLPGFKTEKGAAVCELSELGLIVCFVAGLSAQGLRYVEAYPRRDNDSDAGSYHGPLSLYLSAGFTEAGEQDGVVRVRKELQG